MIALRGLHPQLRPFAEAPIKWAQQQGVEIQVTSVHRNCEQQRALYDNFRRCQVGLPSNPGMSCAWPANPPGSSAHQYGLAWDSVATWHGQDVMEWWRLVREAYGWRVPPKDLPHAELAGWDRYVTIGCR